MFDESTWAYHITFIREMKRFGKRGEQTTNYISYFDIPYPVYTRK